MAVLEVANNTLIRSIENNSKVSKLLYYLSLLVTKNSMKFGPADSYRGASLVVSEMEEDVCSFGEWQRLDEIPYVGEVIAKDIAHFCKSGRFSHLEKVLLESDPLDILLLAEGVDRDKAKRVIDFLNIRSFDDLIKASKENRFSLFFKEDSPELKRIIELFEVLPGWLSYKKREEGHLDQSRPTTNDLLKWDLEFRYNYPFNENEFAHWDIVNGGGKGVCTYSHSDGAKFTHNVGDWVNISYRKGFYHLKWVVLTSKFGRLKGKRIVMGEEAASEEFYKTLQ